MFVAVHQHVEELEAVSAEHGVRPEDGLLEGVDLHQFAPHAVPLGAHPREHKPHGPPVSACALQQTRLHITEGQQRGQRGNGTHLCCTAQKAKPMPRHSSWTKNQDRIYLRVLLFSLFWQGYVPAKDQTELFVHNKKLRLYFSEFLLDTFFFLSKMKAGGRVFGLGV